VLGVVRGIKMERNIEKNAEYASIINGHFHMPGCEPNFHKRYVWCLFCGLWETMKFVNPDSSWV